MTEQPLKDGPTPETEQHGDYADVTVVADDRSMATVKRNRRVNPMMALYESGTLSEEQFDASVEIARIAEEITLPVGMRSASLEARVDNSGSSENLLIEKLTRVQLEATYNSWRAFLPMPKRMVIDLVLGSSTIMAASRRYRMRRAKVRTVLVDSLDRWINIREKMHELIDERDVEAAHYRAGGGVVK